jgi:hypothetical protein
LDNIKISKSHHNIRQSRNLSVLNTDQNFHEFSQKDHEIKTTNQIKITRNHNQILGINSKWKGALTTLIPLLEITEIKEFRIISGSVFLSDHASPITSNVPKLLCCISYTISLREFFFGDRPQPRLSLSLCSTT